MADLKRLVQKKMFIAGILIPVVIQLVFLYIVVPALDKADDRISNMKVVIVNKDTDVGAEIASKLSKELPFKTDIQTDLDTALGGMENNKYSAIFYIPESFSEDIKEGNAKLTYYINQAAPSMKKQILDSAIKNVNEKVNENVFNTIKGKIQENMQTQLSNFRIPDSTVDAMKENIGKGIDTMKTNAIKGMGEQLSNFTIPASVSGSLEDNLGKGIDMMKLNVLKGMQQQLADFKMPESAMNPVKGNIEKGLDAFKENTLKGINLQLSNANVDEAAKKAIADNIGKGIDTLKVNMLAGIQQQVSDFQIPEAAVDTMQASINKGFDTIKAQALAGIKKQMSNFSLPESAVISIKAGLGKGFDIMKENAVKGIEDQIANFQMPASTMDTVKEKIGEAFEVLQYNTVASDVVLVNNSEGFIQTILPFFIFIVYFISSVAVSMLLISMYKPLRDTYSKWPLFINRLIISTVVSLIVPIAVFIIIWSFNIPYNVNTASLWLLLSAGFFAFMLLAQFLADLFSQKGAAPFLLILFPLQLITSNLMFPKEVLPGFYGWVRSFLPSSYFGSGIIKALYGGTSLFPDAGILLLMAVIFAAVSCICVIVPDKKHTAKIAQFK